jgi:hypothetical protein
MPRGAAPGERRGGRAKGTKNKRTKLQRQIEEAKARGWVLPLEYMLYILNTSKDEAAQRWAAEKAAAYCHAKFVSHEVQGLPAVASNAVDVEMVTIDARPNPHPARFLIAKPAGHS